MHFSRLSAADSVKPILDARRRGQAVSADVSLAHLCFTVDDIGDYDPNFHLRPPLREASDRAALRKAVKRGEVEVISASHEPHDSDAKAAPFGLTASLRPHRILGRDGGHFTPGAPADLCVFDPACRWTLTDGTLASSGRNTPYLNQPLTGRVLATMVAGEWAFGAPT